MEKLKGDHFEKIYWFIVGLCIFGGGLTVFLVIYLPKEQSIRIADNTLMFWLSTAVSGGIGYLIGNSAKVGTPTDPNTTIKSVTESTVKTIATSPADEIKE